MANSDVTHERSSWSMAPSTSGDFSSSSKIRRLVLVQPDAYPYRIFVKFTTQNDKTTIKTLTWKMTRKKKTIKCLNDAIKHEFGAIYNRMLASTWKRKALLIIITIYINECSIERMQMIVHLLNACHCHLFVT